MQGTFSGSVVRGARSQVGLGPTTTQQRRHDSGRGSLMHRAEPIRVESSTRVGSTRRMVLSCEASSSNRLGGEAKRVIHSEEGTRTSTTHHSTSAQA